MQVTSTKALTNQTLPSPTQEKGKSLSVVNESADKTAIEKASEAKSASERSALIASSKHKSWSNLSDAQAKLYRLQSMGETFHYSQEALLDLAREMTKKLPESSQLLYQISLLRDKLGGQTQIDNNFLPASNTPKSSFKLDRIDLLAKKDQDESVQIRMPDNSQVNIEIKKNQPKDSVFKEIQLAFKDLGIKVSKGEDEKLIFTGSDKMMDSVWLFQGQGLRIPAGNSVPVNLERLPDTLTKLSSLIETGDIEAARENVRDILQDLSKKTNVVRDQVDILVSGQNSISEDMKDSSLRASEILKDIFFEGDELTKVKGLMTQANVSRENVVDTLSID